MPKPRPPAERFWGLVDKRGSDECWLWLGGTSGNGYGRFRRGPKIAGQIQAHKFSYELHVGPVPAGMYVLHSCDVRGCVNPAHLFIGDARDNAIDCCEKGRMRGLFNPGADDRRKPRRGETSPQAKLTTAIVKSIRASKEPNKALAERYGVTAGHIYSVKTGRKWKHV